MTVGLFKTVAMAMSRKGQVQDINDSDIRAQAAFITELFQLAA